MVTISLTVLSLVLMVVRTAVALQMEHVIHAQQVFLEINAPANALPTANIISVTKSLEPVLVVKQTSMGRNVVSYARDVWEGSATRIMAHAHMAVCLDPVAYSVRTYAMKCHLMAHVNRHLALQMIIMELMELKQTKVNLLFASYIFLRIVVLSHISVERPNKSNCLQLLFRVFSNLLTLSMSSKLKTLL